ncbi:AI-2E family transporter [Haloimpatiens sp. FM7330]|uniref:AI-2E family transporter n=1 Tax=Haloimpatiens sp. FM7330 TaxID=3298610 RepID=UPI00363759DD
MFKNNKIPYIHLVPIIILTIFLFKIINNIESIGVLLKSFLSIVSSFLWGFAIAYLLNPMMVHLEKRFKLKRPLSLLIVYSVVLGSIILIITIISPKIGHSISDLIDSIPSYIDKTQEWLNSLDFDLSLLNSFNINIEDKIADLATKIPKSLGGGLSVALLKAINVTSSVVKALLGFIISIYILKDKEKFKTNFKRFLYAILKKSTVDCILDVGNEMNKIFSKYIIGKAIDSLIIALICFVGLSILKIPYAILISFIVGLTNMIPYFGPFIGMIPSVIITLFYDPIKALTVFLFILVLQQFDGWYLGPKILGDQVGLSPFWIILAIIVGGATFGVIGMFLSVPIMATIKTFLDKFINKRLNQKNINV